jgi:hypothetical protein
VCGTDKIPLLILLHVCRLKEPAGEAKAIAVYTLSNSCEEHIIFFSISPGRQYTTGKEECSNTFMDGIDMVADSATSQALCAVSFWVLSHPLAPQRYPELA